MIIDEAIVILRDLDTNRCDFTHEQIYDAKKLGIEALKKIKRIRQAHNAFEKGLLPGETRD